MTTEKALVDQKAEMLDIFEELSTAIMTTDADRMRRDVAVQASRLYGLLGLSRLDEEISQPPQPEYFEPDLDWLYGILEAKFGEEPQILQAIEEFGECISALTAYQLRGWKDDPARHPKRLNDILQELADVYLMLHQMMRIFGFTLVMREVRSKALRTLLTLRLWEPDAEVIGGECTCGSTLWVSREGWPVFCAQCGRLQEVPT